MILKKRGKKIRGGSTANMIKAVFKSGCSWQLAELQAARGSKVLLIDSGQIPNSNVPDSRDDCSLLKPYVATSNNEIIGVLSVPLGLE